MNILCCFKIVPDLDLLREEDWVADEQHQVEVGCVQTRWNCFDESALEMLLKLSDQSEGFNVVYHLRGLTIGTEICDRYLKTLYALGYEKAIRLEQEGDLRFCPDVIADAIAAYMNQAGDIDVVVLGKQSADGDNGQTPFLLAEYLGWPHIGQVTQIAPVDESFLKVRSITDEGEIEQIIKTPCVISVGNAPNTYLRVPTLKDRMRLGKQPIKIHSMQQNRSTQQNHGMKQKTLGYPKLLSLEPVNHQRMGQLVEGETAAEKAEILYQQYLKERL